MQTQTTQNQVQPMPSTKWQPIMLCETCGSPTHPSDKCPVKKAQQEKLHTAYNTKHGSDSDKGKDNSDEESLESNSSAEIGNMATVVSNDNGEDERDKSEPD